MYTAQDLAERFDLAVKTIYQYVWMGVLPPVGRGRRFGPEHVAALKSYREAIPRAGDRITRACLAERRQSGHSGHSAP